MSRHGIIVLWWETHAHVYRYCSEVAGENWQRKLRRANIWAGKTNRRRPQRWQITFVTAVWGGRARQLAAISRMSVCCCRNGLPCVVWLLTVHFTGSVIYTSLHPRISVKGKLIIGCLDYDTVLFCICLPVFGRNIKPLHSRQSTQVNGSFRDETTWYNGQESDRRRIGKGPHVDNTEMPNHFLPTSCTNCACAAPTRCPIQQKDTSRVRRAFLRPDWIANTKPPEQEVSLPTLQWRFVTHEPGSSVGIFTKLWAGRRRNRGSIPNWYRRSLSSPKRFPRGHNVKLITPLPSKVNLKNEWSYTSIFQNASMATILLLVLEAYFYWINYLTPEVLENNFNILIQYIYYILIFYYGILFSSSLGFYYIIFVKLRHKIFENILWGVFNSIFFTYFCI